MKHCKHCTTNFGRKLKSANNGIGDATAVAEAAQVQFNSQITDMQKAYDDAYGAARSSLEGASWVISGSFYKNVSQQLAIWPSCGMNKQNI